MKSRSRRGLCGLGGATLFLVLLFLALKQYGENNVQEFAVEHLPMPSLPTVHRTEVDSNVIESQKQGHSTIERPSVPSTENDEDKMRSHAPPPSPENDRERENPVHVVSVEKTVTETDAPVVVPKQEVRSDSSMSTFTLTTVSPATETSTKLSAPSIKVWSDKERENLVRVVSVEKTVSETDASVVVIKSESTSKQEVLVRSDSSISTFTLATVSPTTESSTKLPAPPKEFHGHRELSANSTSLRQEMLRCSRAMGIMENNLQKDEATIRQVSQKASLFLQGLWQLIPKEFSPRYKSPCWQDRKSNELHCLPYFMVAGFPKSGTTSIHFGLIKHPQIPYSGYKEPHWWTRGNPGDRGNKPEDYHRAIKHYLQFMQSSAAAKNPKMATWDNSQSTLFDSPLFMPTQDYCAFPAVFSRVLPNMKFIVQMRDPVTRIYSHYLYSCSSTLGTNPAKWPEKVRAHTAETFHNLVASDVKEFNDCLTSFSLYECTNRMVSKFKAIRWKDTCAFISHQIFVGLYYVHITKWLQFYPRENFLFLRIDDLSEPYELMSKITNFLGISPVSRAEAHQWFSTQQNKQSAFSKSRKHEMREDTKQLLEDLYRPYNQMLAELLGDDRYLFSDK